MCEITLAGGAEHPGAVHLLDVGKAYSVAVLHDGVFPQPREERLYVMWDADPKRVVDGTRYAFLYRQPGARGELVETGDADFSPPWSQTKGIQVVDAVRYSEALHYRHEPDAAGHDEDRGVTAKNAETRSATSSGMSRPASRHPARAASA